ncbi:hypothetical protein PG994_002782 [Apiospora phragmitis]|uniref:Uncharacterized protein n=1 Tax=Apiospora phragmitis TaxID=2905665 RepID=A0ABR1W676_9PEZI
MLPREMDLPVGGSDIQLWPTNLTADYFPVHEESKYECSRTIERLEDRIYPSATYLLVADQLSRWWSHEGLNHESEFLDRNIRLLLNLAASHYSEALIYLKARKKNKVPERYGSLDLAVKTYNVETRVPAVRVACKVHDKIDLAQKKTGKALPANRLHSRSQNRCASHSLGELLLHITRREENKTTTWGPVTCTVDAQWVAADTYIKMDIGGFDGGRLKFNYRISQGGDIVRTELKKDSAPDFAVTNYRPRSPPGPDIWTHIKMHTSWFTEVLSSHVADVSAGLIPIKSNPHNRSLFDRLLDYTAFPYNNWTDEPHISPRTRTLEHAISMFFSDGLSRCGLNLQLPVSSLIPFMPANEEDWKTAANAMVQVNKDPVDWFPMPDKLRDSASGSTEVVMRATFHGYAMAARNWLDRVSEAWDSAAEMVVLAQQSSPAESPLLDNTCVGIRSRKPMARIATVEIRKSGNADGGGTAAAEVQRDLGNRRTESIPQADKAYGCSSASGPGPSNDASAVVV